MYVRTARLNGGLEEESMTSQTKKAPAVTTAQGRTTSNHSIAQTGRRCLALLAAFLAAGKDWATQAFDTLILGAALTVIAVPLAEAWRGYRAIGGEWLILPLALIARQLIKEARDESI
jgi:hypothetical protein